MRRLSNMIFIFLALFFLALICLTVYQLKIIGISKLELPYHLLSAIRVYLPVILSASLFFGLVFGDPILSQDVRNTLLSTLIFIIFSIFFYILVSEISIPKIYQKTETKLILKHYHQKTPPVKSDLSGKNFSLKEFAFTRYYPSRKNILFRSGKLIFFIGELTRINQVAYLRDVRLFAYNQKRLEYSVFSRYAKVISQEIFLYHPDYITYRKLPRIKHFRENKSIPLYYDINALWNFPNDQSFKDFNLFSALANADYLINSGVQFIRLGNAIYNKICKIIALLLLLIVAAAMGQSMELKKAVSDPKEIPGLLSLLVITPSILFIIDAFISQLFTFIYTLIV